MSTNKVYGDAPDRIVLTKLATRWDYTHPAYKHGIARLKIKEMGTLLLPLRLRLARNILPPRRLSSRAPP